VEQQSFDTLTRQVAVISRRGSMATLAATGFVAALTGPFTAAAREAGAEKKGGKRKKKHQTAPQSPPAVDQCLPQVAPCKTFQAATCGSADFCPGFIQCCDLLGTCDSAGFFACVTAAQRAQ
jgi:hypothetical protein